MAERENRRDDRGNRGGDRRDNRPEETPEFADRLVAILVMTGFNGILGWHWLTEITLWALAVASAITVVQRMVIVHRQAVGAPLD